MDLIIIKIIISLFTIFSFFIFFKYSQQIGNKISLLDKDRIPLIGGIILYIGFVLNYLIVREQNIISEYLVDIYFISAVFIVALADDKYDLSAILRIIALSLVVIFFIYKNNLFINSINSMYWGFYYFPNNIFVKFIFPTFCIIVLLNAYNFTDGINCLATLIGLSWILYLIIKLPILFNAYIFFIIFLVFFLILNFLNKSYLGDSGNYIISTLIGSLIIILNDKFLEFFFIEEILLLLLVPGLDLIRLFYKRIKDGKSPLIGDFDHFHHLLNNKYGLKKSLFIYLLIINIPIYLFYYFNFLLIYLLILTIFCYLYFVKLTSKN